MASRLPLEGKVVQVRSVDPEVVYRVDEGDSRAVDAAGLVGLVGRVLGLASGSGRHYAVELWDLGMTLAFLPDNLAEYDPPVPQAGGFDLLFPAPEPESMLDFGMQLGETLESKGWAVVQLPYSDILCDGAGREARAIRRFTSLRQEFIPDYLGHGARGKVQFLAPQRAREEPNLHRLDAEFNILAQAVAANSWHNMGFRCVGERWPGMVWVPYATRREEYSLESDSLNDDDVEEGHLEEHLQFLRRRRLCCMMWLESSGEVQLQPAPGRPERAVTLPALRRKLLIFRGDRMTFSYKPDGRFAVLQSWVLEPPAKFQIGRLEGHPVMKAEAMGILNGRPHPEGDRVHVMSVACRLPGNAGGADQYWSMLMDGTDGMLTIPNARWDTDVYCTKDGEFEYGKVYTTHGAFVANHEIYGFDNSFFNIPEEEAMYMSPSQRVVMEEGYSVLFRAGYVKDSLRGKNIGVFLGDTGSDWSPFNPAEYIISRGQDTKTTSGLHTTAYTGASTSVVPCRLSHALDTIGPSQTVDTACSSSLVATGAAMQWLRPRLLPDHLQHLNIGRLQEAVAGGICCQIGVASYIGMCGLHMISTHGRCFTFDASGDGYARGEGCGLAFLKASDSEVDMYDQLSCLLGVCVNQDGRSASMTAPNGPSQQACILQSMREAGNSARDINLAECHGTGTALGDPIEVGALRNVMDPRDTTLALTSSKSNIGHLEGSAGIAGFLKCVGMLMAGTCPPNAHLYSLNPHLDVKAFPCFFDTEAIDSGLNSALTGVSSFGFGGTNGRCDVWGAARFGPNKCGKVMEAEVDQIYTLCPITLGKIDYLTGEPLTRRLAALRRGKRKADVLRDELSRYDVSRYAYDGGFRYRQQEIPEGKEDFPPDSSMFICGSWNGFSMEEMDMDGDNLFSCIITLSQERYELFDLCMDQKEELALFPAVDRAGQIIAVEGPAVNKERKRWCIDGRDTEMCAGTVIQITFQFSVDRMTVTWKEISEKRRVLALPRRPSYFVSGSFTKWRNVAMKCVDEEDFQEWSTTFRIGQRGREDFHILKEGDKLQAIYPTFPLATGSGEEACGPDEYGSGRHFQVKGMPNDEVELSLYVEDGQVTVRTFTAASRRSRQWESIKGWARHSYSVIQPGGLSAPMTMDARRSGVFTCMIDVGQKFDKQAGAFCFHFQVAIDGDSRWVFHPRQVGGLSGEAGAILRKLSGLRHALGHRKQTAAPWKWFRPAVHHLQPSSWQEL
ncbi:unnamed protein product [Effrenium voratum]|nr:unnamed protein product [Effrenium voratum]